MIAAFMFVVGLLLIGGGGGALIVLRKLTVGPVIIITVGMLLSAPVWFGVPH
jgi:hypothetical protein